MKKIGMLSLLLTLALLLGACQSVETFETMSDVHSQQEMPLPREILLELPEGAAVQMLQNDEKTLYLCSNYEIMVEILPAGDLDQTIRSLSGFGKEQLTVMETGLTDAARYEWVWTSAGEGGDVIGRAVVLDDGSYHYCITVMASADAVSALAETWKNLMATFQLA